MLKELKFNEIMDVNGGYTRLHERREEEMSQEQAAKEGTIIVVGISAVAATFVHPVLGGLVLAGAYDLTTR